MRRVKGRALQRATFRLGMPPGESAREFDIADTFLAILPDHFPYPVSTYTKRIEAVASDNALYLSAGEIIFRYDWSVVLTASDLGGVHGNFFRWLRLDGEWYQIHVGRGQRPLAEFIRSKIELFEFALPAAQRAERCRLRDAYTDDT